MRQFQSPPGQTGFPHWQPSQYPPQKETNSSSQQAFPSQQFRKPLSDLPHRQLQVLKGKHHKRMPIVGLVVVAVIIAAFISIAFYYGSHLVSTIRPIAKTTHTASQPSPISTQVPVSQTKSHPTKSATPTQAVLDSDIAQFVSRYGQPDEHSIPSSGYYHFRHYANSGLDFLIVQVDVSDGGVYAQRVKGIIVQAPGSGWNQQQANAACAAFLPSDSVYQRTVKLATGFDRVYFSATLAGLFLASAFTDPNGSQVKAGLFDVQYIYRSGTIIDSCDILIGTQQIQQ